MRAALGLLLLTGLVAGCATPEPSSGATPTPVATTAGATSASGGAPASPAPPSAGPAPASPPAVVLGTVYDETRSFRDGGRIAHAFNVTGGEQRVVIEITSSGPPADRSFESAVVQFYFPQSTSPFVQDLPGKEARTYTLTQQPHVGAWRIVYDGTGDVTVRVRATLE